MELLESIFHIRQRRSTVGTELRGAIATFLTMAYILAVNSNILSGAGLPPHSVAACTALAAGVCSILMGLWANFPIALASGMGLNALVAFTLTRTTGSWQTAMGLVVLDGLLVLALVLIGLREAVLRAIPHDLRLATSAGIGLFIAFLGLVAAGIVKPGFAGGPALLHAKMTDPGVLVTVIGLLMMCFLASLRVKGAILVGIGFSTVAACIFGVLPLKHIADAFSQIGWPDFSIAFKADVAGAARGIFAPAGGTWLLPLLLSLVMVDFFDTLGTVTGIADEAKLVSPDGNVPGIRRILIVDSISASIGGLLGCSSVTSYVESASGVAEGARTGLHSVFVGVLFLLAVFAAPVLSIVPKEATAPALILVGFYMVAQFAQVDFAKLDTAIPAFLTLLTIPLTYSISHGIAFGFITFVAIKVLSLRFRDVHPIMYATAAAFVVYLCFEPQ